MQVSLRFRTGKSAGELVPLPSSAVTVVGRAATSDVVLDDPAVSTHHCVLAPRPDGGGFLLIDAWSQLGTLVNGAPFTNGPIAIGDVITAGSHDIELVAGTEGLPLPTRPWSGQEGDCLYELAPRGDAGHGRPLAAGRVTVVGRGPLAHIQIDDDYASSLHCLVVADAAADERAPCVVDLRSSNGTCVDGRPVHRGRVAPGSIVTVGRTELELRRVDRPRSAPEADAAIAPSSPAPDGRKPTSLLPPPGHDDSSHGLLPSPAGYAEFFAFDDPPFGLTADPDFFFDSRLHHEALDRLLKWLLAGRPVGVLAGGPGCGKSLALACVARHLAYRRPHPVVACPGMECSSLDDVIGEVLAQARALHGGLPAGDGELLDLWHTTVAELRRRNVLVAVLIDDAASVARGYLGSLVRLLEGEAAATAVRVLLAGGHNLEAALAGTGLPEHLGVYCTLGAMAPDEVPAYVGHRLGVASGQTEVRFTRPALELIAAWSQGIPRLINVVADVALFGAFRANEREVTRETVAQAIREALGADLPGDSP